MLIIVVLISLAIIPGLLKIELDNNIRGFLGSNFDSVIKTDYVEHTFDIPKSTFFMSVEADNIYSEKSLNYLHLLHSQIFAQPEDIDTLIINDNEYKASLNKKTIELISEQAQIQSITVGENTYHSIEDLNNLSNDTQISSIIIDDVTHSTLDENLLELIHPYIDSIVVRSKTHNQTEGTLIKHRETQAITRSMIKDVNSIINAVDASMEDSKLKAFDFIEEIEDERRIPSSKEELNDLRRLLEDNPNYEGLYFSQKTNEKENPASWIMAVEVANEKHDDFYKVIDYIEELIENTKDYGFMVKLFGVDYTNRNMNEESQDDVKTQILIVAFVIMLVFLLNFKSPVGVILPELNTIISVFWIFGLMGHLGVKFSIIGLLILPVLFAVTSSYSIHALNQYYKEIGSYKNDGKKGKHIAESMSHILTTIAIAGVTTFVSLVSLVSSNIIHIKTFGIFAGLGVMVSVMLSITFIPAVLVLVPTKPKKKKKATKSDFNNTLIDRIIRRMTYFTIRHRYFVFILLLIIAIGFIIGIYFISTDSSFVMMFDKDHKIRKLSKYFSEHIGGVTTMYVTLDTAPELKDSIKNELDTFRDELKRREKAKRNQTKDEKTAQQNEDEKKNIESVDEKRNKSDPNQADTNDPFESDIFSDTSESNGDNASDNDNDDGAFISDPFDTGEKEGEESIEDDDDDFSEDEFIIDTGDIEFDEDAVYRALKSDILKKVERLGKALEGVEGVGRVYSYADIMKRFNYVFNGKDNTYRRIPDTNAEVLDYQLIFEGDDDDRDGVADNLENLIEPSYNKLNIIVTLRDKGDIAIDTGDYERIEKDVITIFNDYFDGMNVDCYTSGWSILHKDVQNEIVRGQLISIFFSFFVIFLIITFLFRSPVTGLISIIPLSASIFVTFGLMGYIGVPLDIATVLISAVAIGIAVDDTIHYMLHLRTFKHKLGKDTDIETLIYKTSSFTSKAIIYTSVALIFGFLVLLSSTFIPIRQFAYLTAFTLFIATVATLWALPSIILIFPRLVGVKKKSGKDVKIDPEKDY